MNIDIKKWLEEKFKYFPLRDYLLWWAKELYGLHSTAMIVRPCFAMVIRKKT